MDVNTHCLYLCQTGFVNCGAPLGEDELETLAMSMDFAGDHNIHYCVMPKVHKFYGGGLLVRQKIQDGKLEYLTMRHSGRNGNRHCRTNGCGRGCGVETLSVLRMLKPNSGSYGKT